MSNRIDTRYGRPGRWNRPALSNKSPAHGETPLKPQKDDICADAGYVIRVVDTTGDVINSANFNRQNSEA